MGIRSLLKRVIYKLTGPTIDPEGEPVDTWEDLVIRLALRRWILLAGRPIPNWEQLRRFVEIEIK